AYGQPRFGAHRRNHGAPHRAQSASWHRDRHRHPRGERRRLDESRGAFPRRRSRGRRAQERGVTFLSALVMALRELRRCPLRSSLTTLGIVIGVATAIDTITLGRSAMAKITNDIASLGSNLLIVSPGREESGPASVSASPLTSKDAAAIGREASAVRLVA